jgi:cytochrome c-type biogenesis protein CcmE
MKNKHKRLYFVSLLLISFFAGCSILIINLRDNLIYFYSPTEILMNKEGLNKKSRIGGLVEDSSIKRKLVSKDNKEVEEINFRITDLDNTVDIKYIGILPDLFKEGQGVIVEGFFMKDENIFNAKKVLAKHDENYVPPEIKNLLKED